MEPCCNVLLQVFYSVTNQNITGQLWESNENTANNEQPASNQDYIGNALLENLQEKFPQVSRDVLGNWILRAFEIAKYKNSNNNNNSNQNSKKEFLNHCEDLLVETKQKHVTA